MISTKRIIIRYMSTLFLQKNRRKTNQIVKDGKNNKTSQTKDGKQPRKHLLCRQY